MTQQYSWDEMLRLFRLLGGTAENVILKEGTRGRGLMPKDPQEPVHVRVPRNLLFSIHDVEFRDDRLVIKETANMTEAERLFFDAYQSGFSWGATGREESIAFITALDSLPPEVRALLNEEFGFEDLLQGEFDERVQRRFLKSRVLKWADDNVVMPLIELANHKPTGLAYQKAAAALTIQGMVEDEVLVSYGVHDSFSIFQTFGFPSLEPGAFSEATDVQWHNRKLLIGQDRSSPVMRGKAWGPQLRIEGDTLVLPFLMIGHRAMPKQPRGMFRALAAEAKIDKADEVFDIILRFNWGRFLNLLEALAPHQGEMVTMLRTVVRYQLEAISHCVGGIEVETPKPPKEEIWSMSIQ